MVLGKQAVPLIVEVLRDRDTDVRDIAMEELVELDPQSVRKLVPGLRRKLKSKDRFEPVTAMWTLAAIRDFSSLDAIRERAAAGDAGPRLRNTARVIEMLFGKEPKEILERIREHDHELMPWLSKGARLIGSPEARDVLRTCAETAPDRDCRTQCAFQLERIRVGRE